MQRKRFRGRKFLIIKYKVGKGVSNQNRIRILGRAIAVALF